MSFNCAMRLARDSATPIGRRWYRLMYAIESYAWMTGTSFKTVRDELRAMPIDLAVTRLSLAREGYLAARRRFDDQRRREKRWGQYAPSARWWVELGAAVTLGEG